ncbi:hypothetical protein ACWIE7_18705 [Dietzia sp. NPDC055343]
MLERTAWNTVDQLGDSAGMYDKTEDIVEGICDRFSGVGRAAGLPRPRV